MRKSLKIILSLFCVTALFSLFYLDSEQQEINKNIVQDSELKKLQKEVMSERKQKVKGMVKQDSPDKFMEWQQGIRTRDGELRPGYEFNYRIKELLKSNRVNSIAELSKNQFSKLSDGDLFIERGPANVAGRTRALVIDPDDPNFDTWYAGSVGGGVWKTTNAGQSWIELTPAIGNLATSTIVQSVSNPDVIYVGTGEGFGNVDQVAGAGIWKTIDRGVTWDQLSSTANYDFQNIMRMIIDPKDADIVVVATNSSVGQPAIRRTTNGGQDWIRVHQGSSSIQDLTADPSNFQIQYATENGIGVVKSTNSGQSWSSSSNGISGVGRMEIAVSWTDSSRLYLSAVGGVDGSTLWISRDSGASWTAATENGGNTDWLGGQGWYDNTINVNPYDENEVYVGGISLHKVTVSEDNTFQISYIANVYGGQSESKGVHPDQHNIVFAKTNEANNSYRMIICNDGGVSYSDNEGTTFSHTENGYNTAQFYGVDKQNGVDAYVGGMQDNGTYQSFANPDSSSGWIYKIGGDGFEVLWNYNDPNKIMGGYQYNGIQVSINGGLSFQSATNGLTDTGSGEAPFFTKLAKSKQDPDLVFALGASGVWRSDNFGENWNLTKMPDGFNGASYYSQIKTSLVNPQIIWTANSVSSNKGAFVSADGGIEFEQTNPLTFQMGRLTGLETHPTQQNTAFLLYSFAQSPKIIRTTDLGHSWEDISGFGTNNTSSTGFPDVAVYSLVVMPYDTTIIWVGTGIGLFESTDNGESWHATNYGLPPVAIYEMVVVNDQVVTATHGRGIWSISLTELAGYEPPTAVLSPILKSTLHQQGSLVIESQMRSSYDSIQVIIEENVTKVVYGNTVVDTTIRVPYLLSSAKEVSIQLKAFVAGIEYFSQKLNKVVYTFDNPLSSYATNFEDNPVSDFFNDGFELKNILGSQELHSEHNYQDAKENTYTLKVPITIQSENATVKYDDIAIIEPGESGTVYGDFEFWDYVVVEGSLDGDNWMALAPGYDARYNQDWLNNYNNGGSQAGLWVGHKIDLLNTFNVGDNILIRFRLFADAAANGWGWAIDNLEIQQNITTLENLKYELKTFSLKQNYPNPFNPNTTINFSLDEAGPVSLKIYNITGKLVKTVYNRKTFKAGILHRAVWDGTNNFGNTVSSGTFYYRLESGQKISVKKMVLIR